MTQPLDINATLEEHMGWMARLAESHARSVGLNASDAEDIAADVLAEVAMRSLPRFDPARGELRGFLHVCTRNAAVSYCRRLVRLRIRTGGLAPPSLLDLMTAGNLDTEHVERLAVAILAEPSRWLTRKQCRVFIAVTQRGDKSLRAVAKELGYQQETGLHQILRRIRKRIAAAVNEDEPNEQGAARRTVEQQPRRESPPPASSCRRTLTTPTPEAEAA